MYKVIVGMKVFLENRRTDYNVRGVLVAEESDGWLVDVGHGEIHHCRADVFFEPKALL